MLLAWLACLAPLATAAPALRLNANTPILPLSPHVSVLEDPTGDWTVNEVLRAPEGSGRLAWQPPVAKRRSPLHFGYSRSAFWLRIDVVNPPAAPLSPTSEWLLGARYPLLDHLDVYMVRADGSVIHRASGDRLPFATRDVPDRHFYFKLPLKADEPMRLLVRVQSQGSIQVPLEISSPAAQAERLHGELIFMGIYAGALLAMLLYNLMLGLSLRDGSHMLYVLYIGAFGMMQMVFNGSAFQYLWPNSPDWGNLAAPITMGLSGATLAWFTRRFLELRQHARMADHVLHASQWLFVGVSLSCLALPYSVPIKIGTVAATVLPLIILGMTLRLLYKGVGQAKYFMAAFAGLLLSLVTIALTMFGAITPNWLTEHSLQLGAMLEFILLSFALAHRIKLAREENEQLQHAHAEELESRVRNRTRELDQALMQLTQANERLHTLSEQDRLTGLKNRTFLSESLPEIWRTAQRAQQPLSVLMIDIDHFKRVNDHHGHLAGDEALRMVATVLARTVQRPGDHVVRYGGEEFLVVLPNTPAPGAAHIAETIRRQIEEMDFMVGTERVPLTASMGLASVVPSAGLTAQTLLKTADQLLYKAKEAGRNRCVMLPQTLGPVSVPRKPAAAPVAQA